MNVNTAHASPLFAPPPPQGTSAGDAPGAASSQVSAFVPGSARTINPVDLDQEVPSNWQSLKPTAEDASLLSKTVRFIKSAYERVKAARTNLHKALSNAGKTIVNKLFGVKDGKLSESQIAQIDRTFGAVENKLKRMEENSGADIRFFGNPESFSGRVAGVAVRDGDGTGNPEIGISRSRIKFGSNEGILQTIIHEASHSAAGTVDYWYLHNGRSGLGRDMEVSSFVENHFQPGSEMTFEHRVDNADTIAMAALRLGEANAVDEDADSGSVQDAPPARETQGGRAITPTDTPPADRPLRGPVTDTRAFADFIATRPTKEQFKNKYPDVILVMPGELATMDIKGPGERFQANTDANGRIVGGSLEGVGNIGTMADVKAPSARIRAAANQAIEHLQHAKANLFAPWGERTIERMYELYGKEGKHGMGGFSDADIDRMAKRLDQMIAKLQETRDGQRQPQLRQGASNLDDAALEAELVRDATLASGASDRWNVRETPEGLVNARYGSGEEIDPEDISLDDALQNGYTLRHTINTLS